MVLKRAMDWRGVLVLSFLFANGFIRCGIMGDASNGTGPGSESGNVSEYALPNGQGTQHVTVVKLQPNAEDLNNSNKDRHTCEESNERYDCIFKNVFTNGSNHAISFGNFNPTRNIEKHLKFVNSAITLLPKTLVDTFSNVQLLNLELLGIETIEPSALANGRNIKELHLSYNNIASLDPGVLDNLQSLEILAMDGNNLSSIPNGLFKHAKNLKALTLANNNLQRIEDNSFVKNIQLEYVNVTNNQLVHFDLSRLKHLFDVDVSNNKLEKLHIPEKVENVYASRNEIDEVVWPKNNNLSVLMLSHNNLSTTAWLQPFTKLERLDLSHNKIEDITWKDFKQLQRLIILKLNNNRLFTFDMSKDSAIIKSLKILDISHNELVYVEHNHKQFQLLEELYLDHNSIVVLKPSSSWKLKYITLSYNDLDCAKTEELLRSIPSNVSNDNDAEPYCRYEKLPQGLCCKRVDMIYHDRLITKIAEVTGYEKIARANRRCNATSLITTVKDTSDKVTNSRDLPTSQLERDLQALRIEVERVQQNDEQKETQLNDNRNKIDEFTRIYRVVKKGLTQPSYTLGNVFAFLKQRDEFKVNETIARYVDSKAKGKELEELKKGIELLQTTLDLKRDRTAKLNQEKYAVNKENKKLEKQVNRNPDTRRITK